MSFRDCVNRHVAENGLDADLARRAGDLFDELTDELGRSMGRAAADAEAGERAMAILTREAAEKKRRTLLQVKAWQRLTAEISGFRNAKGEADPGRALQALIDRDEAANYSNVEARRKAIRGLAHARMDEVLSTFRRNLIGGTRNQARLENVVREVFGRDTGDVAAKEMAKAWSGAADMLRLRFNAAGGSIPARKDWGMPQIHDPLKVRQVRFEEWRDFILPKLDTGRMIDAATGQPVPANRLEGALRRAYDEIRTDGLASLKPSGVEAGKMLAGRRLDHRFLVFRDADGWIEYQQRFGAPNAFDVMLGHIDGMARDIAALEVLGPNPTATLTYLKQAVIKQAGLADAAARTAGGVDRAQRQVKLAEDMWAYYTGRTNAPIDGRIARGFAGLRQTLVAAKLGAASISAVTDFNFARIAAKMNGLSGAGVIRDYLKLMNPAKDGDRKLAVRLGLIAEEWSQIASAQQRYVGEVSGPEVTQRLADFVMKASLLSPHTQAGRWAFGMEFTGFLADHLDRPMARLPGELQTALKKYGLGSADWEFIRKVTPYDYEGAQFLRPEDVIAAGRADGRIAAEAERIGTRLLEMIQTETEFAVPSASLKGRAAFISDSRPGTFQGEFLRSTLMFKNFAITLLFTHQNRIASLPNGMAKGRYAADLLLSTTLMGGLAIQLKEISKGRDPRSMTEDPVAFWSAALLQGGGMGIFGDFLFQDTNRFGGGLAQTLGGPVVAFADDVRRLTIGNVLQLPGDEKTNVGRELVRFTKQNLPGASLWYARLGLERLVFDQLQRALDPEARASFRRTEQRWRRETGQRFFWRPGRALPDRGADLTEAVN